MKKVNCTVDYDQMYVCIYININNIKINYFVPRGEYFFSNYLQINIAPLGDGNVEQRE